MLWYFFLVVSLHFWVKGMGVVLLSTGVILNIRMEGYCQSEIPEEGEGTFLAMLQITNVLWALSYMQLLEWILHSFHGIGFSFMVNLLIFESSSLTSSNADVFGKAESLHPRTLHTDVNVGTNPWPGRRWWASQTRNESGKQWVRCQILGVMRKQVMVDM